MGSTTLPLVPVASSTPHKRKAVPLDSPPTKRPLLELPSFQESEISYADPNDSTYHPSTSELDDTTGEE